MQPVLYVLLQPIFCISLPLTEIQRQLVLQALSALLVNSMVLTTFLVASPSPFPSVMGSEVGVLVGVGFTVGVISGVGSTVDDGVGVGFTSEVGGGFFVVRAPPPLPEKLADLQFEIIEAKAMKQT